MLIKSTIDTMRPNGLVPSFLVYGVLPTFPGASKVTLKQKEMFEVLTVGRAEIDTIVAESIINTTFQSKLRPEIKHIILLGHIVSVFIECFGSWEGPFTLKRLRKKIIWVPGH